MIKMKMFGLGGQGVVTAAKILVQAAAIIEERYAKSLPAYGHERRGAPIHTDVIIDDSQILLNSFVYNPDIVILFDPAVVTRGIDIKNGIHNKSLLVCNITNHQTPEFDTDWGKVFAVNATDISLRLLGQNIPNCAMLGALAKTGLVRLTSIENAIRFILSEKISENNILAAREAYETTKDF